MMMASAVLLVVQLMLNVMENVEAGVADVLMIVKNKEMATRDVKVGGALKVMNRLMKMMSGTMREKRTTVIYSMMAVPEDSFMLPFRTDFIS